MEVAQLGPQPPWTDAGRQTPSSLLIVDGVKTQNIRLLVL